MNTLTLIVICLVFDSVLPGDYSLPFSRPPNLPQIDEPPTPYAYGTDTPTDMAMDEKDGAEELSGSPTVTDQGVMNQWEALNAKLTYEEHLQGKRDEEGAAAGGGVAIEEEKMVVSTGDDEGEGDDDEAAQAAKEREFAKKRAAHYNEFKVIQAMRAKMEEEEDDDDEDELEGEEGH